MATAVAVDKDYVERLQGWVTKEAKRFARAEGESGVNAYSRHTSAVLAQYGLDGFAPAQISRWIKGRVTQEIKGETLARLGILKKLSTDPEEAATQAYLWLNGQAVPEAAAETGASASESVDDFSHHPLVQQVEREESAAVLRAVALAAVERLHTLAQGQAPEEEPPMPKQTALTNLLTGWMTTNTKTEEDLASILDVDVSRVEEIMSGTPLNMEECQTISELTNLSVEALISFGACKIS
jgi:predicted XRE-type DNA-binding protein